MELTFWSTMEQAICLTYVRSAVCGRSTDSRVSPIWIMKDTPAGWEGMTDILVPLGPWESPVSTAGKPNVETAGNETVACCVFTDPGGEEPPGGKNTGDRGAEGITGLLLAILKC